MKNYEGVFIVDPGLSEDEQKKKSETIKEIIEKHNGKIENVEAWGKRKLAYKINRKHEGVYYLLRFSAEPDAISKLYKTYKLDESLLRVMIVNTE